MQDICGIFGIIGMYGGVLITGIERIKKWIYKRKLYSLLMLIFNMIFILAILIILGASTVITGKLVVKNYSTYESQFMQVLSKNIDYIAKSVENMSRFVISEPGVQKMLTVRSRDFSYNDIVREQKIIITRLMMDQDYIESLSVFDLNGTGVTVGDTPSYISDFSMLEKQNWYQEVIRQKGKYIWVNTEFKGISGEQKNKILFVRVINKTNTMDKIGILMIILNNKYLSEMVGKMANPTTGNIYIYDDGGKLLFGPEAGGEDTFEPAGNFQMKTDGETVTKRNGRYFVTECYNAHMNWHYLCIATVTAVLESQWLNFFIVISITLLVVIFASYIYSRFSRGITSGLKNLNEVMSRAEEQDFKEEIKIEKIDELIRLGGAYNKMMNKINILINEVLKEKLNSRQAKLENLQAQINPHFLYNTLDCISWKAMAGGQTEIAEMIQSLSKMFRFSLGRGEKEIELSREVENTRNYLLLQKKRFEDKLIYLIDIPENVMKFRVIKFFLQPLVENSILHGIQSKPDKGYIGISAVTQDKELVISVWDNGTGVDEKQIAMLLDENNYDNNRRTRGHGIYNVNERLKMRYGEQSALKFENRKNGGTKVTIRIPIDKLGQGK